MVTSQALAEFVLSTGPLFTRYLEGFDDRNRTKQAPGLPNHVMWCLGHCALTMHRASELLESSHGVLPTSDFIAGDGTAGDPSRFDTVSVSAGSVPVDNPRIYPRLRRGVEIFTIAMRRLAEAAYRIDGDPMDEERTVTWGGQPIPRGALVARMVFHNGTHCGQIVDLRRALALPPVLAPKA